MKKMVLMTIISVLFSATADLVYAKEVPYTFEDKERLVRLETKVEEGFKAVNQRIDSLDKRIDALDKRIDSLDKRIDGLDKRIDGLDKRIDGLQGLMYVLLGAIFAQTVGVVGFVLWDRRTALAPAIKKSKELEEKEELLEKALKEYAKQEPRLAEILKSMGLM